MPPIVRRALRIAGWNAALILGGLTLIAVAGEAWLRLTTPAFDPAFPRRFVPGVGPIAEPHAEVRTTNHLDFWTAQRANSLGFLDREPPGPERAAASCHVVVVGDSFVAAHEVPIADKLQVRLEALAAAVLPQLDVTTSAVSFTGTAQVNQLPYYDEYARRLSPNLVVLVFLHNDFEGNSAVLPGLMRGRDPRLQHLSYLERAADGSIRRRPPAVWPAPDPWWLRAEPRYEAVVEELTERSLLARWLDAKRRVLFPETADALPPLYERAAWLAALPGYGWVLDGWEPLHYDALYDGLMSEDPPPVFAEALDFTAVALAEFRRRADRDGAALAILSAYTMGGSNSRESAILRGITDGLGIPVINQHDWIAAAGGRIKDARWPHDYHWTPQGHQWAAEAIFDWLRRHPEVCEDAA